MLRRKKTFIILILLSFTILYFFISFGIKNIDVYPNESTIGFFRKVKNSNTFFNFLKPDPVTYLKNGDLILHADPLTFDSKLKDKKQFCSRIIGIPGDIVNISNSQVFVNNKAVKNTYPIYFKYRISTEEKANFAQMLSSYNVEILDSINDNKACHIICTHDQAEQIAKIDNILNFRKITDEKGRGSYDVFGAKSGGLQWNMDNLGPIVTPEKDMTVLINPRNIGAYSTIIDAHENNTLFFDLYKVEINGQVATEYTIKQNYYFVLNDNRYNKKDSRTWGFVPENKIIGKILN